LPIAKQIECRQFLVACAAIDHLENPDKLGGFGEVAAQKKAD
jgi:hypothetical protein